MGYLLSFQKVFSVEIDKSFLISSPFYSDSLKNLPQMMEVHADAWHDFYDASNPDQLQLPAPHNTVNDMYFLIVIKALRPDKLVPAVRVS